MHFCTLNTASLSSIASGSSIKKAKYPHSWTTCNHFFLSDGRKKMNLPFSSLGGVFRIWVNNFVWFFNVSPFQKILFLAYKLIKCNMCCHYFVLYSLPQSNFSVNTQIGKKKSSNFCLFNQYASYCLWSFDDMHLLFICC